MAACVFVLVWWLYSFGIKSDLSPVLKAESQIYLLIGMIILTFPIGVVWIYSFAGILFLCRKWGFDPDSNLLANVFALWLGFVMFGYVQWFKLFPSVLKRIRARRGSKRTQ
jgi:hypothetical protein